MLIFGIFNRIISGESVLGLICSRGGFCPPGRVCVSVIRARPYWELLSHGNWETSASDGLCSGWVLGSRRVPVSSLAPLVAHLGCLGSEFEHGLRASGVGAAWCHRHCSLKVSSDFLSAGVYKVTPRSCHRFEQAFYTYDT